MRNLVDYLYYHEDGPPVIDIYCGDCLEIMPLLPKVDLVVTDPPYGVDLGNHDGSGEKRPGFLVKQSYDGYEDSYLNFLSIVPEIIKRCLKISPRTIVFMNSSNMWDLPRADIVGGVFVPAACGRNKWGFTNLVHALMYGSAYQLNKGSKHTTFLGNDSAEKSDHPCPKPLRWIKRMVDLGSGESQTVLDPFLGSGTTLVACKELKRNGIGIEINEKYCDIAVKRLKNTIVPFL